MQDAASMFNRLTSFKFQFILHALVNSIHSLTVIILLLSNS